MGILNELFGRKVIGTSGSMGDTAVKREDREQKLAILNEESTDGVATKPAAESPVVKPSPFRKS